MTQYVRLDWPDTVPECHKALMRCDKRIAELEAVLTKANYLIDELEGHEGAEGWSLYLREALDWYARTRGTPENDDE